MNKEEVLKYLKDQLHSEFEKAKMAFQSTKGHATSQELKSEGKYDTRSIEAGYLAGAQKRRVDELEHDINLLDEIDLTLDNETVSVGSLIEIQHNNISRIYFISSTSGGTMIKDGDNVILVISAFSPIGAEVIGLGTQDTFEVEIQGKLREYRVQSIE